MPIEEGDRVKGNDGRIGVVGVMSGDKLTAYVQLDESGPGVHFTLYEVSDLARIDDTPPSAH